MPSPKIKGVPGENTAAHIAGRAIYARGPCSIEQVLTFASFGATSGAQEYNLGKAIENGWLVKLSDKVIGLSERAQHYYAGTEPEPKPMGQIATPRENLHPFKPMSAKHRPNVKGPRADAPDVRSFPSHWAKVAP